MDSVKYLWCEFRFSCEKLLYERGDKTSWFSDTNILFPVFPVTIFYIQKKTQDAIVMKFSKIRRKYVL